jgi:hypothetical protein
LSAFDTLDGLSRSLTNFGEAISKHPIRSLSNYF